MTLTPLEFEEQFARLCWEWDMSADGEPDSSKMEKMAKMNSSIKSKFSEVLDTGEELFKAALLQHAEMPAEVKATSEWKEMGAKLSTIEAALLALRSIAASL